MKPKKTMQPSLHVMGARLAVAALLAIVVSGCVQQAPTTTPMAAHGLDTEVSTPPNAQSAPTPQPAKPAPNTPHPATPSNVSSSHDRPSRETNATAPAPPGPAPVWGQPSTALIYPGIGISTGRSGCTTNFLFTSEDNQHIYIGSAAHCFADDQTTSNCDPQRQFDAPGTNVNFIGPEGGYAYYLSNSAESAYLPINGTLVYNSFYTMAARGEDDGPTCSFNDFALIEIPLVAQGNVTPYFHKYGPATAILEPAALALGTPIVVYGHSDYWLGQAPLQEAWGYITVAPPDEWGQWEFGFLLNRPSIWGDSGSAVMTPEGGAAGILTTIAKTPSPVGSVPAPGTNGATTISRALDYMQANTNLRVKLAEP